MHGMTKLVRERAHAADTASVAHHNEGMRILWHACREGSLPLACIGRPVHPAILQTPLAHHADIFSAHRREPFTDPIYRLRERDLVLFYIQRSPDIVRM